MEIEEKIERFEKHTKRVMDLLVDAYKWKAMAMDCDDEESIGKYNEISDTLFQMFQREYNDVLNKYNQ